MARLPYFNKEDLPEQYKSLLDRPINLNRIMVNSPGCRQANAPIGTYIRFGSKLDGRQRELAILEVGYLARAPYEWSHHIKIGYESGMSDDDVVNLLAFNESRSTTFDANTLAVVTAAREMTLDGAVSPATFEALRGFLDNALIVDLIATIAHYNGVVRLLASLEVDVEDSYLTYLEKYPLPTTPAEAFRR